MSEKKTLGLRPDAGQNEAPALRKKGRGWEISEKRLDALHERARELRRNSSPAHKALAARFAQADLGRYAFTRHAVVGSAIVDFNCHNLRLAIAIDDGEPTVIDTRRDKSLASVGIRVMRIQSADILENIDDVLARITAAMRENMADRKAARGRHFAERTAGDNRQRGPRDYSRKPDNADNR